MPYTVVYHQEATEDIALLPQNIKARIRRAIEQRLPVDPLGFGDPLRRSYQGYRKLRVGNYRVIYRMEGTDVFIFKIGHRREVYN